MPVKLKTKVQRETDVQTRFGKHAGRNIIVSVEWPNIISVRAKGTKQSYDISIEEIWTAAVRKYGNDTARKLYEKQMSEYNAGMRKRKPKKPVVK